jgi:hypothetical protein
MTCCLLTHPTDFETQLGFWRVWVENPKNRYGQFAGQPHILPAVIYPVSQSVWLFKAKGLNRPVYKECHYGTLGERNARPRWHSCRRWPWGDPISAILGTVFKPEVEVLPRIPPRVKVIHGRRRILYERSQVRKRDVDRYGGQPIELDRIEWVSFRVW